MKCRWTVWLSTFLFCLIIVSASPLPAAGENAAGTFKEISIGVLANRSYEICQQRWQPLADYIGDNFYGKKIRIVPLSFKQVEAAVAEQKVDFVLVNPVIYINLEVKYKASRILTLIQKENGRFNSELGGVLFYRIDSGHFDKCTDVQGHSVTAVSPTSLGGYLAVLFELQEKSVSFERDMSGLRFVGRQDRVVYDVLAGKSTFGIVRTGALEKMDAEGLIDLKKLAVINDHGGHNHLPFIHSTRAYPEWPLAKLEHTNDYIADRVAMILLSLKAVDEAAIKADIGGFTTPLHYGPVRKLLQALKQPPYEHQGEFTLLQVLYQYYHYVVIMMILMFLVVGSIIILAIKNNRIQVMRAEQQSTIRKLHLAEADAQARNYMAQELLNAVPLPVFYLDYESNYRGCNFAFEEFAGFSRSELKGKSGTGFSLTNGISVIIAKDNELLRAGGSCRRELKLTDAAGNLKIYEQRLSVYCNRERQPVGLIGVFNDLTDHKQLTTRMTQLSAVVEQAAESIVVTDPQGNIQYVNPAFERITGYTQAEALRLNPRVLKSGRQDDAYYKELWETLAKGETWRGVFVNKRKDETLFDESAVIFPIRNEAGEIISLAAVKRDITQEKAMQSQLRTTQRLEAVGQLAAGVAHELNTPIGFVSSNFESITGYLKNFVELIEFYRKTVAELADRLPESGAETLAETAEFEEDLQIEFMLEDLDDLFTESREGFERISSIVSKLREFSRIDQMDSKESFNFNRAIETTLVVARNEYKYSAEIELYLDPDLPDVMATGGEINQVVLNLIVNAAQAIKEQERPEPGKIVISTKFDEDWVRCLIADDGPGIKPENLERIFDPFFTTKPVGKGTGLGLNISYDIITKKHHGSLIVESTPGEGATFFIALPRRQMTS